MAGSEPYIQLLAGIPAFAALNAAQLKTLYGFCALKVLAKGEVVSVAGQDADVLSIVVSGRVCALQPHTHEAGHGDPVEAAAFFSRRPAGATAIALRETVLLTLGWDDLLAALCTNPDLLAGLITPLWCGTEKLRRPIPRVSRLVICPAGSQTRLTSGVQEAVLAGLESAGEVRVLSRQSFGAGMPGALALGSPQTAHWLQEQELEFDVTVIIGDNSDLDFAKQAIEEADAILFVAEGGDAALSVLERYAIEMRGAGNCRLLLCKSASGPARNAAQWIGPRSYGLVYAADLAAPESVRVMCQGLLGKGNAIAMASPGVYSAAIFGALLALEERGCTPVCLTAAGSAVLPAGLFACGAAPSVIEAIFRGLASPTLWKRAPRADIGLCDPAALDNFLVGALQGIEIPGASRPFAAVSRSLSAGAPVVHREGRLHGAVRAGIAPAGVLPPLIVDGGDILVSGEDETGALIDAASSLAASPVLFLQAKPPPLGATPMSYRSLTGASLFRLSQTPPDKRVRLETVLSTARGGAIAGNPRPLVIPIPDGIMPMDWAEWARLRDLAYEWVSKELGARNLASEKNSAS